MQSQQLQSPTKSIVSREGSLNLRQSLGFSVNQYDSLAHKIHQIISKNPEQRKTKEIQLINQFIKDHDFLNELTENIDLQFVKIVVLKLAEAIVLDQGKILVQEGEKIDHMYIVVEGSLGQATGNNRPIEKQTIYQKLTNAANKYVKQLVKGKGVNVRKLSVSVPKSRAVMAHRYKNHQFTQPKLLNFEKVEHCGIYDRGIGSSYANTIVTLSETLILKIPESQFLISLDQISKAKISELGEEIKKFSCFRIPILEQQRQKFNSLVLALNIRKRKRGDFVYRQNQKSNSLFLLKKGDIKLTKNTSLFEENPNDLYMNRVKLLGHQEDSPRRLNKSVNAPQSVEGVLPYADLRTLYNYQPKKKNIDLGILSPFCIFGEEEHLEKKDRETNAICHSTEVIYYQINLKKIEEIIGFKSMPQFYAQLKESSKGKVLYRQSQYANTINFSNKQHLDYFFVQGEKQKQIPTKFRISKFNRMMEPKPSNQSQIEKLQAPPFYTNFNFHRMTTSDVNPEKKKLVSIKKVDEADEKPSTNELNVMNMTHTWKMMQKKVNMEEEKSRKISSQRHTINLNEPLIENNFFRRIEKERRRIQKQERTNRQGVSSSRVIKKQKK